MKNASFLQVENNPAVERLSVDLYNMFQALSRAFPWGCLTMRPARAPGWCPIPPTSPLRGLPLCGVCDGYPSKICWDGPQTVGQFLD